MNVDLTLNERRVLWGLVAMPELNDRALASALDMPYSTLSSVRRKLRSEGYYRTVLVPRMDRLGAEMLAVFYTYFNPAVPVRERARITTRTIEIFEEIFYSVGETHKGFSIALASDYTSVGRITDLRIETFAREGLLESQPPREVLFPFEISRVPRFLEYGDLLADVMELPDVPRAGGGGGRRSAFSRPERVPLGATERAVLDAMVRFPEMSDRSLAGHLGLSRHTVSGARKRLEGGGLVSRKRIPNLEILGFKVLAFNHIGFSPNRPLDDALLDSDILLNSAAIFLAARKYECVLLSVYPDYEAYREDNTRRLQHLKEKGYITDMPSAGKYMIRNMVVMKDIDFRPILRKLTA